RLVLNGRSGCDKLFLLLQAAECATASAAWLVLYVPCTRRLVDASTPYNYSLRTRTLASANAHIFRFLNTTDPIQLENGEALPGYTAARRRPDGPGRGGRARRACVSRVHYPRYGNQDRVPAAALLIAINDFQALAGRSMYRDPQGRFIRPHHLGIPRLLLEYASGWKAVVR
ncbi:hypothetical protein B0H11DRAFT_1646225, partial [Mycena galericulata]